MKKIAPLLSIVFTVYLGFGQQMVLPKGKVIDSLKIHDSIPGTYSLYLPKNFETSKKWPLLFVFDFDGEPECLTASFVPAVEEEGYVLATLALSDTVSLTNNMIKTGKALERVAKTLPINTSRIYTSGKNSGARYASLTPIFLKGVQGIISINASIVNTELLNAKKPFHYVGVVQEDSYVYSEMLGTQKVLNRYKFPNQVLIVDKEENDLAKPYLKKAMQIFTLSAMGKGWTIKDSVYIENLYQKDVLKVSQLKAKGQLILAEQYLKELFSIYGIHKNLDSLRGVQRELRKDRTFKAMKRAENSTFFKESLLKEDFAYYMDEDVRTHNFNNLGWWNYQMNEIDKFINGPNIHEKKMGNRLKGYVNALAEDTIDLVSSEELVDEDALAFLYMLKTLTAPQDFDYYLNIISLSAKNEDFGTSLFYLEEALKKGFKDTEKLYGLENTALLRINPKFNSLMAKYLKESRYEINEE
ncbi:alpha/beta hydrolase [Flagellimonas allohymeniacidonis]|uniref:Alpha/beta hydrolase n=1 Tax=Flagellimonas allohymeniacidonis TaxID=2517819 RepID=A0A4Q8QJG2_9FLAO|nr:alpha/beta hydrolase [Allomuricauda hymeniacidonis]TAI49458.1 alpha/beta hydrolase [Allomuricauda hymeniacidonis]